jgi:hypothetical protein
MLRTLAEPHYNERVHACESLEIKKNAHLSLYILNFKTRDYFCLHHKLLPIFKFPHDLY